MSAGAGKGTRPSRANRRCVLDDRSEDPDDAGTESRRAVLAAQDLQALENDPVFAGLYVEGPALVVLLTGEPIPASRALLDACPVPVMLRPAQHSRRELAAAQPRLTTARQRLADAGVELVSWGPDVMADALRVEVRRLTSAGEQMIRDLLPGVRVQVDALRAGPDHPTACDRHYPLGPLTLAARACRSCAGRTNSVFHLCTACSRRERTCVLCGEPAVHGLVRL